MTKQRNKPGNKKEPVSALALTLSVMAEINIKKECRNAIEDKGDEKRFFN